MRILFICSGNTCRSPMAAFLARSKGAAAGRSMDAQSAGLFAVSGQPISQYASSAMQRRGIDATGHVSQPVTPALIEWADLILTMTDGHRRELLAQFPHASEKVHQLAAFARGEAGGQGPAYDIVDPYGGSDERYEACAGVLEDSVAQAFARIFDDEFTG